MWWRPHSLLRALKRRNSRTLKPEEPQILLFTCEESEGLELERSLGLRRGQLSSFWGFREGSLAKRGLRLLEQEEEAQGGHTGWSRSPRGHEGYGWGRMPAAFPLVLGVCGSREGRLQCRAGG